MKPIYILSILILSFLTKEIVEIKKEDKNQIIEQIKERIYSFKQEILKTNQIENSKLEKIMNNENIKKDLILIIIKDFMSNLFNIEERFSNEFLNDFKNNFSKNYSNVKDFNLLKEILKNQFSENFENIIKFIFSNYKQELIQELNVFINELNDLKDNKIYNLLKVDYRMSIQIIINQAHIGYNLYPNDNTVMATMQISTYKNTFSPNNPGNNPFYNKGVNYKNFDTSDIFILTFNTRNSYLGGVQIQINQLQPYHVLNLFDSNGAVVGDVVLYTKGI